ncbi:MAG: transglutaminase domain-containing protein [Chloroflexota bacterium]
MSAVTSTSPGSRRFPLPLPAAPAEGWLTVGLVALMAVTVGWSLDDPGWVTGSFELTDFLAPAALLGAAAGFVGAKSGARRWIAHLAGALLAAIILPILVGVAISDGGTPIDWFLATAQSTVGAWIDLAILGLLVTQELGHHLLVLGIIAWGTGQFAAYAVFGHRRPIDAVTVSGIVLLASMAATYRDQMHYLIAFSTAALLLLVRSHALDEQTAWVRRRIGDPAVVRSLYLRGGTAFIALAVLGSLALTATASSAPLQGIWSDMPQRLADVSQSLQRFLPDGGANRSGGGVAFGASTTIGGRWFTSDAKLLEIEVPRGEGDRKFYWRMVVYDKFVGRGWEWGTPTPSIAVDAGASILDGLADDPATLGARREVTFAVRPLPGGYRGSFVVGPQTILSLDRSSTLTAVDRAGFFGGLEREGSAGYTVTAAVPIVEDIEGGLTENRLRAAGSSYPAAVLARHLEVPVDTLGPEALKLLADVKAEAATRSPNLNPYDLAATMVSVLRDPQLFTYSTDVTDVDCGNRSIVECFAFSRQGFCQYYASTMAMLLRKEGIPTRLVQGFLPGDRDPATGIETIRSLNTHAWVEVYFPGYGWVDFDPTGGGVARDAPLPVGSPIPTAVPTPSPTLVLGTSGLDGETDPPLGRGSGLPPTSPTPQAGPFVAIGLLLAITLGGLAFLVWQRGPRGEVGADAAWRGVGRLAARFGFGPRPAQTVFEYAGQLGDVLPSQRPELQTVARAKVEVAYGRQSLEADRLRAVRDAHRRLRLGLLRLALRRRERWSRRRGGGTG